MFGAILKIQSAKQQAQLAKEAADGALRQEQTAKENADRALRQEQVAKESADRALQEAQAAKQSADRALKQAQAAKENADRALENEQSAKEKTDLALRQEQVAKEGADRALQEARAAKENADGALQEARTAKQSADRALQQEQAAREKAAAALRVLFGDVLAARLSEAGLSDAVQKVLQVAPNDQETDPLARALELRRRGELAWERGTLADADGFLTKALNAIAGVTAFGERGVELRASRAQILKRLSDVLEDRGEVSKAEASCSEAVRLWDEVLAADNTPANQLNAAEARTALGGLWEKTGDTRAEATYADAADRSLRVLKDAYHRPAVGGSDSAFELGRALQVYSDAGLDLAKLSQSEEEYRGAWALARELLRLRPLSAEARVQVGAASALYGASLVGDAAKWERMQRLIEESQQQFREVVQFDPSNRRVSRELAAVKLLLATGIERCANNPACKQALPAGQLESAKSWTLDAIGRIRELAHLDLDNRSLQGDIAWGLDVQAALTGAQGTPAAALPAVEEALQIARSAIVDPRDADRSGQMIDYLNHKARLLIDADRRQDALRALDESSAAIDLLPSRSQPFRAYNMTLRANLFKKMGRAAESARLTASANELYTAEQSRRSERGRRGSDRTYEATKIYGAVGVASGAARSLEFDRAAGKYREAIQHTLFNRTTWTSLERACSQSADALSAVPDANPEERGRWEAALRCAVDSAWMAWILSDDIGAQSGDRTDRLKKLYEDRRSLAMFLRHDSKRVGEALALADQGVRDMETIEQSRSPSPDTLFLLADAYYGLGMMREESRADGWEPAFRDAIAYGERLRGSGAGHGWPPNLAGHCPYRIGETSCCSPPRAGGPRTDGWPQGLRRRSPNRQNLRREAASPGLHRRRQTVICWSNLGYWGASEQKTRFKDSGDLLCRLGRALPALGSFTISGGPVRVIEPAGIPLGKWRWRSRGAVTRRCEPARPQILHQVMLSSGGPCRI